MNTGKLLFSKLKTGTSLVYEAGCAHRTKGSRRMFDEDYWDTFAKRLSEQMTA